MLIHFKPILHFYNPWKLQKTKDFLAFSGGIEIKGWAKIVLSRCQSKLRIITSLIYNYVNMTILYLLSKHSGVFARGKESNLSSAQEIQTMLSSRNTNYVGVKEMPFGSGLFLFVLDCLQ